jgi:hypothetical protein
MTKKWEIVTAKEDIQYEINPDANVFALCIDGVVQITLTVDDILGSLYDLNPEIVRCKPSAIPGMTIEEARA